MLEGIGLIEKHSQRNLIKWNGQKFPLNSVSNNYDSMFLDSREVCGKISKEIDDVYKESSKLDLYLATMKRITSLKKSHLYCTQNDVLDFISGNIQNRIDDEKVEPLSLLAIRAPAGSTMEVVDPRVKDCEGSTKKRYGFHISNQSARIPNLNIEIPQSQTKGQGYMNAYSTRSMKSTSSEMNDEEPMAKKRRIASVWDDKWINHQTLVKQAGNSTPGEDDEPKAIDNTCTSLPREIPGVSAYVTVVPIDVFYMNANYDTDSKSFVSKSRIKKIKPAQIMTDALVQGSMQSSSQQKRSKESTIQSCIPWLHGERGVSDFFTSP